MMSIINFLPNMHCVSSGIILLIDPEEGKNGQNCQHSSKKLTTIATQGNQSENFLENPVHGMPSNKFKWGIHEDNTSMYTIWTRGMKMLIPVCIPDANTLESKAEHVPISQSKAGVCKPLGNKHAHWSQFCPMYVIPSKRMGGFIEIKALTCTIYIIHWV